jgi:hypothetical protein
MASSKCGSLGLTEKVVNSEDEMVKLPDTSGQTSANSNSSQIHAVFHILDQTPGISHIHGKFSSIDLAGNEMGANLIYK